MAAREQVRDAADSPGTTPAPVPDRRLWPDALLLGLGALALRLPAFFAPANLGYDDGGYGLAAVAMRQGYAPFRDIFSSQGPLFLPLVRLADLAGFETLNAPRSLAVIAGVVVTLAVYIIGTELLDRTRALLAGGLTATSGVLAWTTGPLTSDGTMAAFATSAIAVACTYRRRPSLAKAITIGLLAGGAVSVKHLLAGPAVLVAWLLVVAARRRVGSGRGLDGAIVAAIAVSVFVFASVPWGTNVIHDNFEYHLDKTGDRQPVANLDKIVTTFTHRDTILIAVGTTGAIATVLGRRRRRRRGDSPPTPTPTPARADDVDDSARNRLGRLLDGSRVLWWWVGLVLVVVVAQDPMFRNHLAALVAPLALLAARFRPPWIVVGVVAAVALPFQVADLQPLLRPQDFAGQAAVATADLDGLPPDAWVLSDDPGIVWRAGLGTDPFFADPSALRFLPSQGPAVALDEDRLVESAENPRVCAVIVRSPKRFGSLAGLPGRLFELGYELVSDFGDGRGVYLRDCPPDRLDQ